MDVESVPPLPTHPVLTERLPDGGSFHEFMLVFVCDGHIVNCSNVLGVPQMLDRRHKSFCAWVEKVFRNWSIVLFAPNFGLFALAGGVSGSLTEADEP